MPKNTTFQGELAELEIAVALTRAGRRVLKPLSSGLRYDVAIDNGDGTPERVQCKTGLFRNGVIAFRTCNTDARRPRGVPYHGQIEAFGVHCPQTGRSYLIPITELTTGSTACLRISPPKNGQLKRVRYAAAYEIR